MTSPLPALEKKVLSNVQLLPSEEVKYAVLSVKQPFPPLVNVLVIILVLLAAILLSDSRNLTMVISFLTSIVILFGIWTISGTRYYVTAVTDQRLLLVQFISLNNHIIKNQWAAPLSKTKIKIDESGLFFTPMHIQLQDQHWSLKIQHLGKDKNTRMQNLSKMRQLFQLT